MKDILTLILNYKITTEEYAFYNNEIAKTFNFYMMLTKEETCGEFEHKDFLFTSLIDALTEKINILTKKITLAKIKSSKIKNEIDEEIKKLTSDERIIFDEITKKIEKI